VSGSLKCFEKISLIDCPKMSDVIAWDVVGDELAAALRQPVGSMNIEPPEID
jgi:hypothetical protein